MQQRQSWKDVKINGAVLHGQLKGVSRLDNHHVAMAVSSFSDVGNQLLTSFKEQIKLNMLQFYEVEKDHHKGSVSQNYNLTNQRLATWHPLIFCGVMTQFIMGENRHRT